MRADLLPNLIVGGVNKAATTSLFAYLSLHPEICASSIKETRYFWPIAMGRPLPPLETYTAYFRSCGAERYRLEASPIYIFGGVELARAMRETLGPIKLIFTLRHPVGRLLSYFKFEKARGNLPSGVTADDYARRALDEFPTVAPRMNGAPLNVYQQTAFLRGLAQGFYSDYLEQWYSVFPDSIRVIFFEDFAADPGSVVRGLCAWLNLDPSIYDDTELIQENRSASHRSRLLFALANFTFNTAEPFWRKHPAVRSFLGSIHRRVNEKQSEGDRLSESVRAELEAVYGPYNEKLRALLSQAGYRDFPAWVSGAGKLRQEVH